MFKLAFRNLSRRKRRTLLTFSVITFAVMYYIVFAGMLDGVEKDSIHNFISVNSAHIKIFSKEYDENTFTGYIKDPESLEKKIKKLPMVKNLTHRLKLLGFLDNGKDRFPVLITGIDIEKDREVFALNKYLKGKDLRDGIWVGGNLAKNFNVKEGDSIYLQLIREDGEILSKRVRIEGILNTPDIEINNSYIYIPLKRLQGMMGTANSVSEIDIIVSHYKRVERDKRELLEKIKDIKVKTWIEEGQAFLSISRVKSSASSAILFFIVIIGIIGTANTLLISVFERMREIGTLKSMGMTDGEIMRLFITEGAFMGIIGSTLGLVSGVLINYYLSVKGIDMSPLIKDMDIGYKISGVIKSTWDIKSLILAAIMGPLSTMVASYIPARIAKKMTAAECLRWV